KAEFREPAGRLRPPAAGVDHEVRHQGVHLAPLLYADAADPAVRIQQPLDTTRTGQRDIGMREGTLPHAVFEEPSTVAGNIQPRDRTAPAPCRWPKRLSPWGDRTRVRCQPDNVWPPGRLTCQATTLRADYCSETYVIVSPLHPGHPSVGMPPRYSPRNFAAPM